MHQTTRTTFTRNKGCVARCDCLLGVFVQYLLRAEDVARAANNRNLQSNLCCMTS